MFLDQTLVELGVEIGAAVPDDDDPVIEVERGERRREDDAARRDAEHDQRVDVCARSSRSRSVPAKAPARLRHDQIGGGWRKRGMNRAAAFTALRKMLRGLASGTFGRKPTFT